MTTLNEHTDRFYREQVQRLAQQYRDLADAIERRGLDVRSRVVNTADDLPVYMDAAVGIVREIRAFDGNTLLDHVLTAAADSDLFLRMPDDDA